jgi:hypothetical protein
MAAVIGPTPPGLGGDEARAPSSGLELKSRPGVRFDAAFFVGYHSKAGTADGILSHTWIPAFQDVRVNGLSVGEYGLNGFLSGSMGVSVILLTATTRP